jgi:hypothetical protein
MLDVKRYAALVDQPGTGLAALSTSMMVVLHARAKFVSFLRAAVMI